MPQASLPYIVMVQSGPIWHLEEALGHVAEAFSRHYEGEILTRSGSRRRLRIGRFEIRAYPWKLGPLPEVMARLRYICGVIARGVWLRWVRGRRLVVITYDPLQSGIIGLLLRITTGSTLICEVNGVYGHPDTLIDVADRGAADAKRRRMLRVGGMVLRRAHAIKLLYSGQLVGFPLPPDRPPRVSFHDIVNAPLFTPQGIPPERQIILVGHPFLLKGVDLLLEAFSRVSSEFPDWRLAIVGWQVEDAARRAGAPIDGVAFFGPQPPGELRTLVERSSVLVLPSRSEGMGRVLLEAAFLARPRIGSRAGGIPTVIEDGVDGLLFDAGDVQDLERVLRRFLELRPDDRREMGLAARRRALRDFTIEVYIGKYRDLIEKVTARRRGAQVPEPTDHGEFAGGPAS
jgi:glycosyltransferase involved in cell wall biosynthesis